MAQAPRGAMSSPYSDMAEALMACGHFSTCNTTQCFIPMTEADKAMMVKALTEAKFSILQVTDNKIEVAFNGSKFAIIKKQM